MQQILAGHLLPAGSVLGAWDIRGNSDTAPGELVAGVDEGSRELKQHDHDPH